MGELRALTGGISAGNRIPLSGIMPSQDMPRGAMPGGTDPLAGLFKSVLSGVEHLADALSREGAQFSAAQKLRVMKCQLELDKIQQERQSAFEQQITSQPGAMQTQTPNINGMGGANAY